MIGDPSLVYIQAHALETLSKVNPRKATVFQMLEIKSIFPQLIDDIDSRVKKMKIKNGEQLLSDTLRISLCFLISFAYIRRVFEKTPFGGDSGTRTHDLCVANASLYHLSYIPKARFIITYFSGFATVFFDFAVFKQIFRFLMG